LDETTKYSYTLDEETGAALLLDGIGQYVSCIFQIFNRQQGCGNTFQVSCYTMGRKKAEATDLTGQQEEEEGRERKRKEVRRRRRRRQGASKRSRWFLFRLFPLFAFVLSHLPFFTLSFFLCLFFFYCGEAGGCLDGS
jgi:hypothetical protein